LESPQFLYGKVHLIIRYGPYVPGKNWILKKLKMVFKYSNQLEEGKILDSNGEKERSGKFPICRKEGGNFVDQEKIGFKKIKNGP
jgi:hypothetical protein